MTFETRAKPALISVFFFYYYYYSKVNYNFNVKGCGFEKKALGKD